MKNTIFRVDAANWIGVGHLMRCIAFAREIKEAGANVTFLSREMPNSYKILLDKMGISLVSLTSSSGRRFESGEIKNQWLSVSQDVDSEECIAVLSNLECDLLVVDHYGIDDHWECRMRPFAKKIFVIDDLANRNHDCDYLLDQNYYIDLAGRYKKRVSEGCLLLLGPKFALLKTEFGKIHKDIPLRLTVKNILVSFGGVDANNFTAIALQAIAKFGLNKFNVDVVIGAEHPNPGKVFSMCKEFNFNTHIQTSEMAKLMAHADLAIGAGGATTWKRCCLALPSIIVTLAENQVEIARALDLYGAAIYLGREWDVNSDLLFEAISGLASNPDKVSQLSKLAYDLVDGMGVARVTNMVEIRNENFGTM